MTSLWRHIDCYWNRNLYISTLHAKYDPCTNFGLHFLKIVKQWATVYSSKYVWSPRYYLQVTKFHCTGFSSLRASSVGGGTTLPPPPSLGLIGLKHNFLKYRCKSQVFMTTEKGINVDENDRERRRNPGVSNLDLILHDSRSRLSPNLKFIVYFANTSGNSTCFKHFCICFMTILDRTIVESTFVKFINRL